MPSNKGIFNRKGAKEESDAARARKRAQAEKVLLDEIAAGHYGGDPTQEGAASSQSSPTISPEDVLEALEVVDQFAAAGSGDAYGDTPEVAETNLVDFVQAAYQMPVFSSTAAESWDLPDEAAEDEAAEAGEATEAPADGESDFGGFATADPFGLGAIESIESAEPASAAALPPMPPPPPPPPIDAQEAHNGSQSSDSHSDDVATAADRAQEDGLMTQGTPKNSEHIERLRRGLELVITEEQVMSLSARAIAQQVPQLDTELLMRSDTAELLHRALSTGPKGDGPGCSVSEAFACPAMRLQRMLVFENSEYLDACPYLVMRGGDPVGAVCIPFKMPDNVGGVLHATSPVAQPIADSTIDDLAMTMTLVSRRSYEIRSGEALGNDGVAAAVAELLSDRFGHHANGGGELPEPVESIESAESVESVESVDPAEPAQPASRSGSEAVEAIVAGLLESASTFAIALVHLDKFRLYARTHGTEIGEAAIRRFHDVATEVIRPHDSLVGDGDEFFLVFPDASAADAKMICDRVRSELAKSFVDESLPGFTASIGIADTDDARSFDELVEYIERSVVHAEASGRDIVVIARALPAKDEPRPVSH